MFIEFVHLPLQIANDHLQKQQLLMYRNLQNLYNGRVQAFNSLVSSSGLYN